MDATIQKLKDIGVEEVIESLEITAYTAEQCTDRTSIIESFPH